MVLDKYVYDGFLRKRFFQPKGDLTYKALSAIKKKYVNSDQWLAKNESKVESRDNTREIINNYKWSIAYLSLVEPNILKEIKKFEANSKLFRSLTIPFLLIAVFLFINENSFGVLFILLFIF